MGQASRLPPSVHYLLSSADQFLRTTDATSPSTTARTEASRNEVVRAFLDLIHAVLGKRLAHVIGDTDAVTMQDRPRGVVSPHAVMQFDVRDDVSEQLAEWLVLPRKRRYTTFERVFTRLLPDQIDHGLVRRRLNCPDVHPARERTQRLAEVRVNDDGHLVRRHSMIVQEGSEKRPTGVVSLIIGNMGHAASGLPCRATCRRLRRPVFFTRW